MTDKRSRIPESYNCVCGVTIADKSKSLKKHISTKRHLDFAQCPPHHWSIESSSGHLSDGYCIKCNKQDKFENSISSSFYLWAGRNQKEYEVEEKEKEIKKEITHLVAPESN